MTLDIARTRTKFYDFVTSCCLVLVGLIAFAATEFQEHQIILLTLCSIPALASLTLYLASQYFGHARENISADPMQDKPAVDNGVNDTPSAPRVAAAHPTRRADSEKYRNEIELSSIAEARIWQRALEKVITSSEKPRDPSLFFHAWLDRPIMESEIFRSDIFKSDVFKNDVSKSELFRGPELAVTKEGHYRKFFDVYQQIAASVPPSRSPRATRTVQLRELSHAEARHSSMTIDVGDVRIVVEGSNVVIRVQGKTDRDKAETPTGVRRPRADNVAVQPRPKTDIIGNEPSAPAYNVGSHDETPGKGYLH